MKRILLVCLALLASSSLWAQEERLNGSDGAPLESGPRVKKEKLSGSVALSLESGRFRRGELLHSGAGGEVVAGLGQDSWGASLWGDRASAGDFSENGLYLRFGSEQFELGFAGYQTKASTAATATSQAEARLSFHSSPKETLLYDFSLIQASTIYGQEKWLLVTGGVQHETSTVDSLIKLTLNGKDDTNKQSQAHSIEVHAELSFPAVGQWFFVGAGLSAPLSSEAKTTLEANASNGGSSFSEVHLGVGYGF